MTISTTPFIVSPDHHDARLDVFLAAQLPLSRTAIKQLIDAGQVTRNGALPKKAGDRVHAGDSIVVLSTAVEKDNKTVTSASYDEAHYMNEVTVLAETDQYVVVGKPAGMLVHPNDTQMMPYTLAAWLLEHYPEVATVGDNPRIRPGIVHRLDKDASGILVVARTQAMFQLLKEQFKARTVEKEYTVLVHGVIENDYGDIDFPIARGKDGHFVARPSRKHERVATLHRQQPGKDARTEFWVEKRFTHYSLLKVKIHTGRTHQIRVHMYAFGNPVVGDTLYTKKMFERYNGLSRLFLHASQLSFVDDQGNTCHFSLPLPNTLTTFLNALT